MDWSKTKTIFIIVFSILNVFLYSLYLDRYTEAERIELLPESTIEEKLRGDNITYATLPETTEEKPYVRGESKIFTGSEIDIDGVVNVLQDRMLQVTYDEPIALEEEGEEALEAFVADEVPESSEYALWKIDEDQNRAVFFQQILDTPLFHSGDGQLTVFWNEDGDIIGFEQSLFDNIIENEEKKELIKPLQAIHTLYQKSLLETNSRITEAELGYSMHVQVSENRQMFVPTWRIRVQQSDGEEEDHFVNAIKDGVIELNRKNEETAE
ncbi:MAG: two-component system regulatory protein YycI [Bacillota bacterium]